MEGILTEFGTIVKLSRNILSVDGRIFFARRLDNESDRCCAVTTPEKRVSSNSVWILGAFSHNRITV